MRLGSLGDIIHAIPAQQLLKKTFPSSEIHWLTKPPYKKLLRQVSGIQHVWIADTENWNLAPGSVREILGLISSLRAQEFDMAVDFQGLIKSAILTRLGCRKRAIGFSKDRLREPAAGMFYSHRTRISSGVRHVIECNIDLIFPPRFAGISSPRIPLQIPQACKTYVDRSLRELGVEKPILINPGAGWPTKTWPLNRFADLAEMIRKELHLPVIFTWGPGEQDLLDKAGQLIGLDQVKSFPTDILQLAELIQRSRLMIAGDTGPLHLAVALGTPTVAILGPADPTRTGPFCAEDEIVMHSRKCPHPYKRTCKEHFCMDIRAEEVFEAVRRRLGIG